MFCKNCGKLLSSADKFCAECGTRVEAEKPKKTAPLEPMFFVEKREEPVQEKKPKRVIHLDEFSWDLDGYPTENRKTEAVDFDWASVLEDKARVNSPKPVELRPAEPKHTESKPVSKKAMEDPLGEMPKTVEELLAFLPDNVLEVEEIPEEEDTFVEEPEEVMEEPAEVPEEEPETEKKEFQVKSLEQIIEDFGPGPIDEPTRLIDKSQMKADSVDRFYVFSKKQAEYQNLLDQEYDRIQNDLLEKEAAEAEGSTPTVEEILASGMFDTAEELAEEPVEEVVEEVMEEPAEVPEEEEEVEAVPSEPVPSELVAIVWSMPPAGIIVEKSEEPVQEEVEVVVLEEDETTPEEVVEEPQEDAEETPAEEAEETAEEETSEEKAEETEKEHLTFADIFNDEDEEEETRKGGGCLKFIATVLTILVIAELAIFGIQHFAPESEAAKMINQVYGKAVNLILGEDTSTEDPADNPTEEPATPSETEMLIEEQKTKNENITEIVANPQMIFEEGKDYGYEELVSAYAFKDSPWYESEEGKEVTYGDELIGTLIQYYSALPDMVNDVNKDVLDYADDTSALYDELAEMEGDKTRGYTISKLEIGEIKTGQNGFYVLVNVTSADKMQPEQTQQAQLVYLEAIPSKNVIKIKETKNI